MRHADHPQTRFDDHAAGAPAVAPHALRLAVVTETYPPEVNGVAMTVARLVQGLAGRGHALQLVRPRQHAADHADVPAADGPPGLRQLLLPGLPIPRYPQLKMGLPARRALLSCWTAQRPDLVHLATEGPLGWSALQAARALRLPVTTDFRTNFHAYSRHYGIGWLRAPILAYLRRFHNDAQATMVPTEALRRELVAEGFRDVAVVARGVDAQQFSPAHRSAALRAAWGAGPDTLVVACVGRLAPEKNLGLLLQAFEAMRRQRADSRLLLVGDGPARRELQAQCPQALFAGNRSGADLAAHYASADAFVFPSVTETFGNVTPEAMASGLPVLAYGYAAAARLIRHGENGLLAPLHDAAAFVAQAAQLAADIGHARALGHAARQTALAHQWDAVVGQVEALMRSAIHRAPQVGPGGLQLAAREVR
ncbi:MAG: glycosyltransferase family 1 protein [Burkholderiaceae bacterium]|nr:glycosyltransferase family 1 protein [Burkholderiaceae bacterium]